MEFHTAHEKVVQSRKKYIIPILLGKVKTNKIEDADLRMYLESHTYLDSKNKVCCLCHQNDQRQCESIFLHCCLFLPEICEEKAVF